MKVRNKTYKKSEYKGKEITAPYPDCPCRPCYYIHNVGYRQSNGKWKDDFQCLTRHRSGCPDNKKANHLIRKDNPLKRTAKTKRTCLRCGIRFKLKDNNFSVE